jgi:hypothetical protein
VVECGGVSVRVSEGEVWWREVEGDGGVDVTH